MPIWKPCTVSHTHVQTLLSMHACEQVMTLLMRRVPGTQEDLDAGLLQAAPAAAASAAAAGAVAASPAGQPSMVTPPPYANSGPYAGNGTEPGRCLFSSRPLRMQRALLCTREACCVPPAMLMAELETLWSVGPVQACWSARGSTWACPPRPAGQARCPAWPRPTGPRRPACPRATPCARRRWAPRSARGPRQARAHARSCRPTLNFNSGRQQ